MHTPTSSIMVVFGADGDLTKRKLIPSLYNLTAGQHLPKEFAVIGLARTEMTTEDFRRKVSEGRAELESYWRLRLDALAPTAFGLEEIAPTAEGVVLDYLSHEGKLVRIAFTFSRDAKIQRTACAPAGQALR